MNHKSNAVEKIKTLASVLPVGLHTKEQVLISYSEHRIKKQKKYTINSSICIFNKKKKKDKNINYNSKHTKIFKIFMGKLIGDSNNFIRKVFYDLFIA